MKLLKYIFIFQVDDTDKLINNYKFQGDAAFSKDNLLDYCPLRYKKLKALYPAEVEKMKACGIVGEKKQYELLDFYDGLYIKNFDELLDDYIIDWEKVFNDEKWKNARKVPREKVIQNQLELEDVKYFNETDFDNLIEISKENDFYAPRVFKHINEAVSISFNRNKYNTYNIDFHYSD
jgi:hypothetical protein